MAKNLRAWQFSLVWGLRILGILGRKLGNLVECFRGLGVRTYRGHIGWVCLRLSSDDMPASLGKITARQQLKAKGLCLGMLKFCCLVQLVCSGPR